MHVLLTFTVALEACAVKEPAHMVHSLGAKTVHTIKWGKVRLKDPTGVAAASRRNLDLTGISHARAAEAPPSKSTPDS